MSEIKTTEVLDVEVSDNGTVMVKSKMTLADGKVVLHRKTIYPGNDYSGEEKMVQDVCASAHTPDVIEAYKAAIAAQGV